MSEKISYNDLIIAEHDRRVLTWLKGQSREASITALAAHVSEEADQVWREKGDLAQCKFLEDVAMEIRECGGFLIQATKTI